MKGFYLKPGGVGIIVVFITILFCFNALSSEGTGVSEGSAGINKNCPPINADKEEEARLPSGLTDPGTGPWNLVPKEKVLSVCRLDPKKLEEAEQLLPFPWAIIRYGQLCWQHDAMNFSPREAYSATKTLGALVAGIVAYQTRNFVRNENKNTGPFSDMDRVDWWFDGLSYNKDAHVGHVLAMVANNESLESGKKTMTYDGAGSTQITTVSFMLNTAISQCPDRLGNNLEAFTKKFLYEPLGMTKSTWTDGKAQKNFALTWKTDVLDMARVGLLMLNRGVWTGKRILSEEWIYRMTHPAFEDANTAYGYLTWLNASSNYTMGGIPVAVPPDADENGKFKVPSLPGPCAPVSIYKEHPHGLSTSPDCNYKAPYTCEQKYDVGVWQAIGLLGQVIQGHPGLDMVIVARDVSLFKSDDPKFMSDLTKGFPAPKVLWDVLRGAVIAGDPIYKDDEQGFCRDYGSNKYAPDLK